MPTLLFRTAPVKVLGVVQTDITSRCYPLKSRGNVKGWIGLGQAKKRYCSLYQQLEGYRFHVIALLTAILQESFRTQHIINTHY
jgi:hypothetical protein